MIDSLREVRETMDAVHKRMLDASRADYETLNGRIPGPGLFLELLMNDTFFAWLRPMSGLMAEIDEALDDPEGLDAERIARFRGRLESILLDQRYLHYLQTSPELVMDHAALRRALGRL